MTTQSWSTRIRHDSDAMFREWGLEFSTKLGLVGLVQTGDSGQVNWATVTRAGANANAGYEIWRFNDTQQGTAPIYMRVDYGTGSNAGAPRIQITVGTGSNGSGTITGTALTIARSAAAGNSANTSDSLRNSYMCCVDGFFGFNWKQGGGASEGVFFLNRSCDATGAADAIGAAVQWNANGILGSTAQCLRFAATAATYTATTSSAAALCQNWQDFASTLVGSDPQVELCWGRNPRTYPLFGVLGVRDTEFTTGNTFSATAVGSSARTYIALASTTTISNASVTNALKSAMLWE